MIYIYTANNFFRKNKEAIRAYQLERLRYYYAVCEFDSDETAIAVYEGCDGAEYETSGVRFDLRFIPPEMDFDVGLLLFLNLPFFYF